MTVLDFPTGGSYSRTLPSSCITRHQANPQLVPPITFMALSAISCARLSSSMVTVLLVAKGRHGPSDCEASGCCRTIIDGGTEGGTATGGCLYSMLGAMKRHTLGRCCCIMGGGTGERGRDCADSTAAVYGELAMC